MKSLSRQESLQKWESKCSVANETINLEMLLNVVSEDYILGSEKNKLFLFSLRDK